jgi:acetyl-CoA synthetase
MPYRLVTKDPVEAAHACLPDYEQARESFTWEQARAWLDGLPGERLNMAYEAVDRHVAHGDGDRIALRFLAKGRPDVEICYSALAEQTSRFADVLSTLGVRPGERVFGLSGRLPELYVAILGTLKFGAVFCPLFSAFGPEPIALRLELGEGRVLTTLEHVLLIGDGAGSVDGPGVHDLSALMAEADPAFPARPTEPDDMALLHFTSGTTGRPKGAVHVHRAVVAHHMTARYALDLQPGDVFWCTADPGWVTGTSYGVIAPLTCGVTSVVDEEDFDVERWYRILEQQRVTVWYTAPTALRMLMRAGTATATGHDLSRLRHVASVGEPLNPEVVVWGIEALGRPIHDTWWQTETGAIMIANYASAEIRPGCMGRPVPGIEAALALRDTRGEVVRAPDGGIVPVTAADVEGEIALRAPWPSMMRAYLGDDGRYAKAFADGWYLSGDLARRDDDGWFWFVGRGDDVIKSAGHLIGPFEVESALMEHPSVAEAGVIGLPDEVAGEVVAAYVALRSGFDPTDELNRELVGFARTRLGAAVAPRRITFQQDLPKTRSGKIMRRLLKARELGLPEGDLSTLETGR